MNYNMATFQSTLPRGERHFCRSHDPVPAYFNPRSHEGSDGHLPCLGFICGISIHAPTRGATLLTCKLQELSAYFNPRSHEGSDDCNQDHRSRQTDFNPRSHEGSDILLCWKYLHLPRFQSRSHEGSDPL